jgi:hypothetical protein
MLGMESSREKGVQERQGEGTTELPKPRSLGGLGKEGTQPKATVQSWAPRSCYQILKKGKRGQRGKEEERES